MRRTIFFYGAEEVAVDIRPQHGVDALLAPRRTVLDPILAAAAAAAGAELRYRTAFEDVLRDGRGRVTGALLRTEDGTLAVDAGLVVGADGRRSKVARAVGAEVTLGRPPRRRRPPMATSPASPTEAIAGTTASAPPPARSRPTTACTSSSPACRRHASARWPAATGRRCSAACSRRCIRGSRRRSGAGRFVAPPVGFVGEPGFLRRAAGPGWALVGDAGYFKDPITAHGITDALRDAGLLAAAAAAGTDAALGGYERPATRCRGRSSR